MDHRDFHEGFFAMVFSATGDTIKTEIEASKAFRTSIIPTPREISESCGLAIRFEETEEKEIKTFFDQTQVPCALYFMSRRDGDGKRKAEKIGEHD